MSTLTLNLTGTEKLGRAGFEEVGVGLMTVIVVRLVRNKTMQSSVKIINETWPTDTIQYIFLG